MSPLLRKIERIKWNSSEIRRVKNIPSDAITCCLRTSKNTLSVWQINHNEEEKIIKEGALAMVTGPEQKHIESIDIVLLNPKEIKRLDIKQEEGRTLVQDLANSHRNISNLTYAKLGILAKIILKKLHREEVIRKTKRDLISIVIEACRMKRLKLERLSEKLQSDLKRHCEHYKINIDDFDK